MKLSKRLLNYTSTEKEYQVISERIGYDSNRKVADITGIPRRTVDRIVNKVQEAATIAGYVPVGTTLPKILVIDIETAPMVAYLWSLWQNGTNIGALESGIYMLSWAAKWVGSDEVLSDSLYDNPDYEPGTEDDGRMLRGIWKLLDDADFVVAHNGDNFDIKHLNTRFLLGGLPPPSPYKSIDTLKIAKRKFKFDSNKLEYLLQKLYGEGKVDSGGMETWIACLKGDEEAWDHMVYYNEQDVVRLERLYLDIRQWDHLHPSFATYGGHAGTEVCNSCGSEDVAPTGKTVSTNASVFEHWVCNDCGHNMRGRTNKLSKEQRQNILASAK